MVERIPKVEVDRMRVQRKEDAADDGHGGGQQGQQSEEDEKSRFSRKLDFKRAMGDESSGSATHRRLWDQPPARDREAARTSSPAGTTVSLSSEEEEEEDTHSTTITFLRAVGLLRASGHLNWATVSLYTLALIGVVAATIFLVNALV